jgi:BTB/POZ domain
LNRKEVPTKVDNSHNTYTILSPAMTNTATFNVGGQVYQVSRSLLDQYPDTMLFQSASEIWKEDPEAEIFIPRNGSRFQYVLDYLRDGILSLPSSESEEDILLELEYYGVNFACFIGNSNNNTTEYPTRCVLSSSSTTTSSIQEIRDISRHAQMDHCCAEIAIYCWEQYLQNLIVATDRKENGVNPTTTFAFGVTDRGVGADLACFKHLDGRHIFGLSDELLIEKVCIYLKSVGLKLDSLSWYPSKMYWLTLRAIDPVDSA